MQRNLFLIASWLTALFPVWVLMGNAPQDIAMSSVALLFLVHSWMQKNWRWCAKPWVKCMGALWLYMTVRGAVADYAFYANDHQAFAQNSFEALRRALPFGRYFVFAAALACWTLKDGETRRRFFTVLAGMLLALAADCVFQWFAGKDILGRVLFKDNMGHIRLTGPYNSLIPGIILAWFSFLAFLPVLMTESGALRRGMPLIKSGAYCLFILAAIAFTGERIALLITLAGWVLAILLLPNKRGLLLVFAGGIAVLGIVALTNPLVLSRQGASTLHMLQDWKHNPYGQLLDTDLQLAALHPVFGEGANYFRHNCPKLYPGYSKAALEGVCNIHPHNIYLEWLIDNGIMGLGLFIAFLVFVISEGLDGWRRIRADPYVVGCLIAFAMRVWPFASSTNFSSPFGAPPFWLVLGAWLACAAAARESISAGARKNPDSGA